MSTPIAKFGSVERALLALLVRDLEALGDSDVRVGGDWPTVVDDFYVRIDKVSGRSDSFEGDFVVSLEVFSADYSRAEDISQDIEAIMLAHGITTVVSDGRRWTFDEVYQNVGIDDLPWPGEDGTYRLAATYAFTVRRGSV